MKLTSIARTLAATIVAIVSLSSGANASMIVLVYDDSNDLYFEWSGSLELGGISSNGTFSGTFNWLTPSVPRMHGLSGSMDFYNFPSIIMAPFGTGTDFLQNGLKSGDSFGITISDDPRLYVPAGYTNEVLQGSLKLTGETMASQGIDLTTPVVYDFGPTIGTVTFVPEPSSTILLGIGALGVAIRRSRSN